MFLRVWPSPAPLPAGDGSQHPSPLSSLLKSKKKDVPRGTRGDPGLGSSESSAGARSLGPTARWARADGERPSGRPRPSRPHRGSSRTLVAPGPRLVGSGRAREQAAAVRPRSSRPRSSRPRPRRFALPPPRSGDGGRVRRSPRAAGETAKCFPLPLTAPPWPSRQPRRAVRHPSPLTALCGGTGRPGRGRPLRVMRRARRVEPRSPKRRVRSAQTDGAGGGVARARFQKPR